MRWRKATLSLKLASVVTMAGTGGATMIETARLLLWGRECVQVTASADAETAAEEARVALESALGALEHAGFSADYVMRSRLFARDAEARRDASDMRLRVLAGARRAASSSYIDPARLPTGASVAIQLLAMRPRDPRAIKSVREYDPPIAPPMFAACDGVIFLSGNTDVAAGFQVQLARIMAAIDSSLAEAGAAREDVVSVGAYVARAVDPQEAWASVRTQFPKRIALSLSQVDGYSAPEKLVELEATAQVRA